MSAHDEWLAERATGIGSSDVPAIFGLSPFCGPHGVWLSKMGRRDERDDAWLRYGHHAERAILGYVAEVRGLELEPMGQVVFRHPRAAWAVASPDAAVLRDGKRVGVVEGKNYSTSAEDWGADGDFAGDDTVPIHVRLQTMHQMWVTGWREESYIAASLFGRAPRIYPIAWDDYYERAVVPRLRSWWHTYVVGRTPPPIDATEECGESLKLAFPGGQRERVERPDLAELAERVAHAKEMAEAYRKEAAAAENELRASLRNDERAIAGGVKITRVRSKGRPSFDARALEQADPETFKRYVRQGAPFEYLKISRPKGVSDGD